MHALDRPFQQPTYDKLVETSKKHIIIEAPTGFGKSALPANLAHFEHKVLANVRTKSLQAQYGDSYDFAILKGLENYKCLDVPGQTAGDCSKCKNPNCPYELAKTEFLCSSAGTLNYAKFLSARQLVNQFEPEYLFLDEAHQLSDLVCEFSGIEFTWQYKTGKPNYVLNYVDRPAPIIPEQYGQELCWAMGLQWLENLKYQMEEQKPSRPPRHASKEQLREWRRYNELYIKVDNTLNLINSGKELWYIKSDYEGFMCKPLTARFHFPHLFNKAPKIVLMSATIGQFSTFAAELGLNDYEAIQVPNSWPAPLRPIENLGGPEYTYKMDENERNHHAQLIASRIAACPEHWSGIIHVTSKAMANELGQRLRYLLDRPIMIPFEGWGTEQAIDEWYGFCDREKGALVVSWAFWEGIDAGRNQISIVARCPYPDFKSAYEKARFEFDRRAALQRIANQVVQAWGRVRRGRAEDYGPSKLVGIADRKWLRLKNYISSDILESIVTTEYA